MKSFKKMKLNLYLVLISSTLVLLSIDTLSIFFSVKNTNIWIGLITFCVSLLLFLFILKNYKPIFDNNKEHVIKYTFKNVFNTESLNIHYRAKVNYEGIETLGLENNASAFRVSEVILGKYKNINILSYNITYSKEGNRKGLITTRLYIISGNKELNKFKLSDLKSHLISDSNIDKKSIISNGKLYFSYGYSYYTKNALMDPMAYKNYELFEKRFKDELDLINKISSLFEE